MATFKNRALTLATVGVLSGSALTIATNGDLQARVAVVEPPVTVLPQGGARGPGPRIQLEYPRRFEYFNVLGLDLQLGATFEHEHELPHTFKALSGLDLFLFGDAETRAASLGRVDANVSIEVISDLTTGFATPVRERGGPDFTLGSQTYTRFSHAGDFDHAAPATVILSGQATVGFKRYREIPNDIPVPRSYGHIGTLSLDTGAWTDFTRAERPSLHVAADHAYSSEGGLDFEGTASVSHSRIHAARFAHTAPLTMVLTGQATFTLDTPQARMTRVEATKVIGLTGGAFTDFFHDNKPHTGDEDDEILLMFANMMQGLDE